MGTFGELLSTAPAPEIEPLFDLAIAALQQWQHAMTRFVPDSPIERLNDLGEGTVDGALREVLGACVRAHALSDGRVDVCIGSDLIRAGYDRDFDELDVPDSQTIVAFATRRTHTTTTAHELPHGLRFQLDDAGEVRIDDGVRIDLGGIAKGWAADRVRDMLAPAGSCLVNLGGDIALHVADDDEPWPVGVELLDSTLSLALAHGGMATSGQDRRAWHVGDTDVLAHHVIDPRTGAPATSDVLRITVVAASCIDAEIWAKALFLVGVEGAVAEANSRGIAGVVLGLDGAVHFTGALAG